MNWVVLSRSLEWCTHRTMHVTMSTMKIMSVFTNNDHKINHLDTAYFLSLIGPHLFCFTNDLAQIDLNAVTLYSQNTCVHVHFITDHFNGQKGGDIWSSGTFICSHKFNLVGVLSFSIWNTYIHTAHEYCFSSNNWTLALNFRQRWASLSNVFQGFP